MKIEKIIMPYETIKDKDIPMDSIVMYLNNKMILVCMNFNHSRKQNLELFAWLPLEDKWVKTYAKNKYTEIMWDYYRKHQQKRNKHINYAKMMKHDRKHKHSGGGSRIYNGNITDYECSNNPLHDFRRCYN